MQTSGALIGSNSGVDDPYAKSIAASTLRARLERHEQPAIACLDIDSTLTGDRTLANAVRARLEELSYVVMFDTSRTEEMLMTAATYQATRRRGLFFRPPPHLGECNGSRTYVPPEEAEATGILDGDLIAASTGTRILVRQQDGTYLSDRAYAILAGQPAPDWRSSALRLLTDLFAHGCPGTLASIESVKNYDTRCSDVFPPDYRIQINLQTVEEKFRLLQGIEQARRTASRHYGPYAGILRNLRVTDDSRPETGGYKLFLTPRKLSKARAIEHVVASLCRRLKIERARLSILFAGDSFPDVGMGLHGGLGTDATFLLAGGSRLVESLTHDDAGNFAGEPMRAIRRRLRRAGAPGRYRFEMPLPVGGSRELIIGDQIYPGTQAVETVYRYVLDLDEKRLADSGYPAPDQPFPTLAQPAGSTLGVNRLRASRDGKR
jgi:hypothetical protein